MAKKRVRLTESNDPLSRTDEIIKGYQQSIKSGSEEDKNITSQEYKKTTGQKDSNTKRQKDKKTTSQQVNNSESKKDNHTSIQQDNKSTSHNSQISYPSKKEDLKKVTFQISSSVLEMLDRLHLQLQLDLGKAKAPYKEVIVEDAISKLLEMNEKDKNLILDSLLQRQKQRV